MGLRWPPVVSGSGPQLWRAERGHVKRRPRHAMSTQRGSRNRSRRRRGTCRPDRRAALRGRGGQALASRVSAFASSKGLFVLPSVISGSPGSPHPRKPYGAESLYRNVSLALRHPGHDHGSVRPGAVRPKPMRTDSGAWPPHVNRCVVLQGVLVRLFLFRGSRTALGRRDPRQETAPAPGFERPGRPSVLAQASRAALRRLNSSSSISPRAKRSRRMSSASLRRPGPDRRPPSDSQRMP